MPELADDLAAGSVHGVGNFLPACNLFVAPDAGRSGITAALRRDIGGFGNDQTGSGTLRVVLRVHLVGNAVFAIATAGDRGHYDAISQFNVTHGDGGEQVGTVTVICHGQPELIDQSSI